MKTLLKSKTFWVNIVAAGAILAQAYLGITVYPEEQVALLVVINLILRIVTKEEIGNII